MSLGLGKFLEENFLRNFPAVFYKLLQEKLVSNILKGLFF